MPGLHEVQREFAAALRGQPNGAARWIAADGLSCEARLRVYRHNSAALFETALALTYPVVRRRVGDEFFARLVVEYRAAHPSRCGDLHEVGRAFPAFVASRMADGGYGWLGELAALEWACADAGVAADAPAIDAAALATVDPEALASVRLRLVPSARRVAGTVPILAVWRANQSEAPGAPVDLSAGAELVLVHRTPERLIELRSVPPAEFEFVGALGAGETLERAIDASSLSMDALPGALHRLFAAGTVAGLS